MNEMCPALRPRRRRRRAPPHIRRSAAGVGQDRHPLLRRSGRPDRAHAPRAGRRAQMDRRAALPQRPQLLHAAAGARGHAACHLRWLAAARPEGWAGRRPAVRAARRAGGAWRCRCSMPRSASCRSRRRCSSASRPRCWPSWSRRCSGSPGARLKTNAEWLIGGGGLRRHLLPVGTLSADRAGAALIRLLPRDRRPCRGATASAEPGVSLAQTATTILVWLAIWIAAAAGGWRRSSASRTSSRSSPCSSPSWPWSPSAAPTPCWPTWRRTSSRTTAG